MVDSAERYYSRFRRVKLHVLTGVMSWVRDYRRAIVRRGSHLSGEKTPGIFTGRRIRWVELTLVVGLLVAVLGKDIQSVGFHGDESRVINTSYVLGPLLRGEFSSPAWDIHYTTLTAPPVTRYIIGIGRRIGGIHSTDLNLHSWNFSLSTEANVARGAMPSQNLLWWSRLPMVILAMVSGVLLFFLTSTAAGRLAGYVLLILFILNPYFLTVLRRAMGESPLLAFILLAAFAGYKALGSWQTVELHPISQAKKGFWRPFMWFAVMGIFSGLAAGSKLNGISVVLAGLGLCALFPFTRWNGVRHWCYAMLYASVLVVATVLTFVALNPFLYPNPLQRTQMMVEQRVNEIREQQNAWPDSSVHKTRRFPLVLQRVFEDYAAMRFLEARAINLFMSGLGLAYLLSSAWYWLQKPAGSCTFVLLLIALSTATPSLFTPLDWDRYYLLPVVFSTVFISVGIACTVNHVLARVCRNGDYVLTRAE